MRHYNIRPAYARALDTMKGPLMGLAAAVVLIAVFALTPVVCGVNEEDGTQAVEALGMTEVHIGGYAWFRCSKSDEFASHFTAKNAQGKKVEGVICCGWVKSCTVRF